MDSIDRDLLTQRGAAALAHPGGTLLEHLSRTAHRLESWGGSPALVRAGLWHAAYGTQGFATVLFAWTERDTVCAAIGEEAEALVYAYCALDRTRWPEVVADRLRGDVLIAPDRLRTALAELTAANELDVLQHAQLDEAQRAAIGRQLRAAQAWLSPAAASDVDSTADAVPDRELAYRDSGERGSRLLFWHGGAGPEHTWARQLPLSDTFRVRLAWRRGYAPSAAVACIDWEQDTRDLLRLMIARTHVIAHSYGGVSALLAATLAPERFASLTLIEAPLWTSESQHPDVQRIATLSRAFAKGDPNATATFLALAGLPELHPETTRVLRGARAFRDPGEARPVVKRVAEVRLPVWIVSGNHDPGIERVCDAVAAEAKAQRCRLAGAGHAVQRHAAFNDRLRAFLQRAGD
ncbi:MAG TPA: alpha/beta hydrolase [Polyangiales bacterium]|nr:alpha/beta hydrolase [Polyangiales bacterium]